MIDKLAFPLLLAAAVGSGLIGGLFFAFSSFIMRAFDRLPAAQAIAAMQSINVTIINPLFFLAFFGTAVAALLLFGVALLDDSRSSAAFTIAGAGLYLAGSILVTMALNVPLNNQLAAGTLPGPGLASQWQYYRTAWTHWNHVRTVATLLASGAFVTGAWLR